MACVVFSRRAPDDGDRHPPIPAQWSFSIPFNGLFVPREYGSVNCCICMCPQPIDSRQN